MRTYHITENDGTDWGLWSAIDENEAVNLLVLDVKINPESYGGSVDLDNLNVTEI